LQLHFFGNRVISSEGGHCKKSFRTRFEHSSSLAHELRLVSELLLICVTLSRSTRCLHRLGVAHQSSLRSPTTTMSFSISHFRRRVPNQSVGDFRTITQSWHPRTGITTLLHLSTTTELVVPNAISQHNPHSDSQLARHRGSAFPRPFWINLRR
jgi:hypothetical protein